MKCYQIKQKTMSNIKKIKAEIERLKGQLIRGACAAQIEMETNCKDEAYNEVLAFIDSLPEEKPSEDLEKENRKTRDAEVILNGHGLLVDVTKWADGYKLKVIIKEN